MVFTDAELQGVSDVSRMGYKCLGKKFSILTDGGKKPAMLVGKFKINVSFVLSNN